MPVHQSLISHQSVYSIKELFNQWECVCMWYRVQCDKPRLLSPLPLHVADGNNKRKVIAFSLVRPPPTSSLCFLPLLLISPSFLSPLAHSLMLQEGGTASTEGRPCSIVALCGIIQPEAAPPNMPDKSQI